MATPHQIISELQNLTFTQTLTKSKSYTFQFDVATALDYFHIINRVYVTNILYKLNWNLASCSSKLILVKYILTCALYMDLSSIIFAFNSDNMDKFLIRKLTTT